MASSRSSRATQRERLSERSERTSRNSTPIPHQFFCFLTCVIPPQYYIYLFERILLCCKEMGIGKKQNKTMSMGKNTKPVPGMKKRSSLQLKGRIFMQNVTDVVSLARNGMVPALLLSLFFFLFFADAVNQK